MPVVRKQNASQNILRSYGGEAGTSSAKEADEHYPPLQIAICLKILSEKGSHWGVGGGGGKRRTMQDIRWHLSTGSQGFCKSTGRCYEVLSMSSTAPGPKWPRREEPRSRPTSAQNSERNSSILKQQLLGS